MLMALGHVEGPSVSQVYPISYNVKGILFSPDSLEIGRAGSIQLLMSHHTWLSRASVEESILQPPAFK